MLHMGIQQQRQLLLPQWSYPHQGRGADELLPQQRPRQAVHRVGTDSGTDESRRCGSHHDVHSLGRGIVTFHEKHPSVRVQLLTILPDTD